VNGPPRRRGSIAGPGIEGRPEVSEHVGTPVEAPQVHAMARVAQTRDGCPALRRPVPDPGRSEGVQRRRRHTKAMAVVTQAPLDDPLQAVDEVTSRCFRGCARRGRGNQARRALLRDSVFRMRRRASRAARQSLERFNRAAAPSLCAKAAPLAVPLAVRPGRHRRIVDLPGRGAEGAAPLACRAAYWLACRHPRLNAAPIGLLRSGRLQQENNNDAAREAARGFDAIAPTHFRPSLHRHRALIDRSCAWSGRRWNVGCAWGPHPEGRFDHFAGFARRTVWYGRGPSWAL
jgi:hypothetical protein